MALHLIIDGYNLIRQSAVLREYDRESLGKGRSQLLQKLAAYKRVKRYQITVVFDGWIEGGFSESRDIVAGITIHFSQRGERADAVIRRFASRYRDQAVIVTSDRDLGRSCVLEGSEVISSQDFEERLDLAVSMNLKGGPEDDESDRTGKGTEKKGPAHRLPKSRRRHNRTLKKL